MATRNCFLSSLGCVGLALAAIGACSGGGGGGGSAASSDVKSPYPRYTETMTAQYVIARPDGTTRAMSGHVIGKKQVAGKEFSRFSIGDVGNASEGGIEIWANLVDDTAVEFAGAEFRMMPGSPLDLPVPYASATLNEPITIEIEAPIGESQAFSVSGMSVIGDPTAMPMTGTVEGTYVLTEKNVAVETPAGTVSGCNHYTLSTQLPALFGANVPVAGDVFYHPQLGVVKADLQQPLAGLGLGFSGSNDFSDLGGGYASVQKLALLGEGFGSNYELSTHDAFQVFDADKETHANMLMEVRWVDDAKAKTQDQPFVMQQFGTVFGFFPSTLMPTQVSFFFPDEAGKGYTHWIGFVSQAAKNEMQNGIAYSISATYEPDFSPVRVASRIVYKRIATSTP